MAPELPHPAVSDDARRAANAVRGSKLGIVRMVRFRQK
jgi:hypothetical protein